MSEPRGGALGQGAPEEDRQAARAEALARRMVGWASETGTPGEAAFAGRLRALLLEQPYFREHPDGVRLVESHGYPATHSVVALVRGRGRRTLLLGGHYDTVSLDNYHELKPLACSVDALKQALLAQLSARPGSEQERRALQDLRSGAFLPGRGMLDMKGGIAAGLVCLEHFAAEPERCGNLLLVVTPDEEGQSRGMRSLRDALPRLAAEWGLEIAAGINLDATSDLGHGGGDGRDGRCIYAGTIGKLLPFALVIGCNAHASYPFEGVSAAAMAAGILARLEGNAELAERDPHDTSPPPICLELRDLRQAYEVTTPERCWLAFNWLYHAQSAEDLFQRFQDQVRAGAEAALARFAAQAAAYRALTTPEATTAAPPPPLRLLTLAELRQRAAQAVGEDFEARYAEQQAQRTDLDHPLALSRQLTAWLADRASLSGPAVVVGFAGLHYPPAQLDLSRADDRALTQAIDAVIAGLIDDRERCLRWRPLFQGISDMSFLGQASAASTVVADNTPAARLIDRPAPEALRFPVVNLGPWGRELHQRLERIHAPYAFGVLPRLLGAIARHFLASNREVR